MVGMIINSSNVQRYGSPDNLTIQRGFDYVDQPVYILLDKFGSLIPQVNSCSDLEKDLIGYPAREMIDTRLLRPNTLLEADKLKIEWMSSLAFHLQFNADAGVLRVFKFPSFCELMLADQESPLLSRLFKDHRERSREDISQSEICSNKYFRELISTYCLIFQGGTFNSGPQSAKNSYADSRETEDPLLLELLSSNTALVKLQPAYEDLAIRETAQSFSPHVSIPFFGARLLELQRFVRNCDVEYQASTIRCPRNAILDRKSSQGVLIVLFILLLVIWISRYGM
ncbi:hypothetical protein DL98DRAFT_606951 [Cadophora sp. DSE1049]|nr:hypothetical protein DL98DRAFT_606951 [Cadophora sp. DSE1049]